MKMKRLAATVLILGGVLGGISAVSAPAQAASVPCSPDGICDWRLCGSSPFQVWDGATMFYFQRNGGLVQVNGGWVYPWSYTKVWQDYWLSGQGEFGVYCGA
jgi:hypothetical protein